DEMSHAGRFRRSDGHLPVGAHVHALRLEPHGNLSDGLATCTVHDRDHRVVLVGDVEALAFRVYGEKLWIRPGGDAPRDLERLGVDDGDDLVITEAYEDLLIVRRHDDAARPTTD